MFERFTDRARRVMGLANQETLRYNHEAIGPEHILLGLVKENSGVAANALRNLGVNLGEVRVAVEKRLPAGKALTVTGRLPFTVHAKNLIGFAFEEARALGHNYVGTEHLLLGLLRVEDTVAVQVLVEQGIGLEKAREEVLRLLGHEEHAEAVAAGSAAAAASQPKTELPGVMRLLLGMEDKTGGGAVELTARAKKIIELAFDEARALGHNYVDAEHLLLALLREGEAVSAQLFAKQGVAVDKLRNDVLMSLGREPDGGIHV